MITIRPLREDDHGALFAYLDEQLGENGRGDTPLFQPLSRAESRLTPELRARFLKGFATPVGEWGWRRMWIALDAQGAIAGHIDLRARQEEEAAHRVLLGMGVRRSARRQGVGERLIGAAAAWAQEAGYEWIDLEVLLANAPARRLYLRTGFAVTGELPDLLRIDGEQHGYTYMSRPLA